MSVDNLEGTMLEGVEVKVEAKDVAREVVSMAGKAIQKGADFAREHPRETMAVLTAAVGAISLLTPEAAQAQGPNPTPIDPELIRGAADLLTGGKEPASSMLTGIVRAADVGAKTAASC